MQNNFENWEMKINQELSLQQQQQQHQKLLTFDDVTTEPQVKDDFFRLTRWLVIEATTLTNDHFNNVK